jgi:hypothetical protein
VGHRPRDGVVAVTSNAPGRSWAATRCALRLARSARSAVVLVSSRRTSARPRSVPPLFVSALVVVPVGPVCASELDVGAVALVLDQCDVDASPRSRLTPFASPRRGQTWTSLRSVHAALTACAVRFEILALLESRSRSGLRRSPRGARSTRATLRSHPPGAPADKCGCGCAPCGLSRSSPSCRCAR